MTYLIDMSKFKTDLLQKIEAKTTKRGAVSLYLDKELYAKFKATIEPLTISEVIEGFMKQVVDSESSKGK